MTVNVMNVGIPICRNFDKRMVVYFRLNEGSLFNGDCK